MRVLDEQAIVSYATLAAAAASVAALQRPELPAVLALEAAAGRLSLPAPGRRPAHRRAALSGACALPEHYLHESGIPGRARIVDVGRPTWRCALLQPGGGAGGAQATTPLRWTHRCLWVLTLGALEGDTAS